MVYHGSTVDTDLPLFTVSVNDDTEKLRDLVLHANGEAVTNNPSDSFKIARVLPASSMSST